MITCRNNHLIIKRSRAWKSVLVFFNIKFNATTEIHRTNIVQIRIVFKCTIDIYIVVKSVLRDSKSYTKIRCTNYGPIIESRLYNCNHNSKPIFLRDVVSEKKLPEHVSYLILNYFFNQYTSLFTLLLFSRLVSSMVFIEMTNNSVTASAF